ncbi:MAG: AmmeMemoRadiSam system radical SAM enzyme [Pseudomonadota bacterium]
MEKRITNTPILQHSNTPKQNTMNENRRHFIKTALMSVCGIALCPLEFAFADSPFSPSDPYIKEAYFYRKLEKSLVQCGTCPNRCVIRPGNRGRCRVKVNIDGKLYSISYGNPCAVHVDPVEKKPLFHFLPGTKAFSIAVAGCNFRCLNCQNWQISQTSPDKTRNVDLTPAEAIEMALKYKCKSIAYTYSEATTFYEYMVDTSRLAKEKGVKNIWVTNGYMTQEALNHLCDVIDAANVDLKSFSDEIYMDLNGGHLQPVLDTLKLLHKRGIWLEITNLVVPTYNDNMEMIQKMCNWILKNLGPDYPLHFSRFHPLYKLVHLVPTPIATLEKARETAIKAGLHHVYIGNVPGMGEDTICPNCKKKLIKRIGYTILSMDIVDGKCKFCKTKIAGRWD